MGKVTVRIIHPEARAKAVPKRGKLKSKIYTFWIGVKVAIPSSARDPIFLTTGLCRDAERDNLGIVKHNYRQDGLDISYF